MVTPLQPKVIVPSHLLRGSCLAFPGNGSDQDGEPAARMRRTSAQKAQDRSARQAGGHRQRVRRGHAVDGYSGRIRWQDAGDGCIAPATWAGDRSRYGDGENVTRSAVEGVVRSATHQTGMS